MAAGWCGLGGAVLLLRIVAALVAGSLQASAAQEPHGPTITRIQPDWEAAAVEVRLLANDETPDAIRNLNVAVSGIFPNAAASPVPVLMPFDTAAFLRDRVAGTPRLASDYFAGFRLTPFFVGVRAAMTRC
jgi:hypothetical protein